MDNICATCSANSVCKHRYDGYEYDEVCEKMLTKMVESARDEYRAAWFEYIDEFENC